MQLVVFGGCDLFSRKVDGWQICHRINQYFVNDALQAALLTRGCPKGGVVHSDRGSHNCIKSYNKYWKNMLA